MSMIARYILTTDVPIGPGTNRVENDLLMLAHRTDARLTRTDYEDRGTHWHQIRRRTLRKYGR